MAVHYLNTGGRRIPITEAQALAIQRETGSNGKSEGGLKDSPTLHDILAKNRKAVQSPAQPATAQG